MVTAVDSMSVHQLYSASNYSRIVECSQSEEFDDSYIPSADYSNFSGIKGINSIDDYKIARHLQLREQAPELKGKVKNIDYETEYKDYMKSRGCKNEEELQALNNTMYKTMDDLKRGAASGMTSVMMNMAIRNPEMTSARHNINSIISSSNVNDLADYVSASYSGLESNGKALQTLLSKAEDSGLDGNYLNKISAGIDDLFEQIKKELKEEAKTGEKFDYGKYQEAYQKKMIAQAYS
ncbi:MAG: hypothetical protein MZV64_26830 [Ignavibacteriales bacterium]|nr:hypothetical protein [Ignavibacteriales bacterium]